MTYSDTLIKTILRSVKTIAMVGASANDIRPSYFAMMYLLNKGYKIVPVNPGHGGQGNSGPESLCQPERCARAGGHGGYFPGSQIRARDRARGAGRKKTGWDSRYIWMQLGVVSEEAAKLAEDAGLTVIMDRCPKIEHGRFSGELGWMGVNRKVIDNRKPLLFGKGGSLNRL